VNYQWTLYGTNLPDATTPRLRFRIVGPANVRCVCGASFQTSPEPYRARTRYSRFCRRTPSHCKQTAFWVVVRRSMGRRCARSPEPALVRVGHGYELRQYSWCDKPSGGRRHGPLRNQHSGRIESGSDLSLPPCCEQRGRNGTRRRSTVCIGRDSAHFEQRLVGPPPAGLSDVVAISGGGNNAFALKNDGTVVVWGDNSSGQINVPVG